MDRPPSRPQASRPIHESTIDDIVRRFVERSGRGTYTTILPPRDRRRPVELTTPSRPGQQPRIRVD